MPAAAAAPASWQRGGSAPGLTPSPGPGSLEGSSGHRRPEPRAQRGLRAGRAGTGTGARPLAGFPSPADAEPRPPGLSPGQAGKRRAGQRGGDGKGKEEKGGDEEGNSVNHFLARHLGYTDGPAARGPPAARSPASTPQEPREAPGPFCCGLGCLAAWKRKGEEV